MNNIIIHDPNLTAPKYEMYARHLLRTASEMFQTDDGSHSNGQRESNEQMHVR